MYENKTQVFVVETRPGAYNHAGEACEATFSSTDGDSANMLP